MPTYHVLGVPLRTGSLYPGNENDAQAYREAQLVPRLRAAGCEVMDEGDVAIPSYLPHHSIPPIRSWPGPRIAWDHVGEGVAPYLRQPGHVPLLIGCDCSLVVGTALALRQAVGDDVHVLYIDGDFDDAAPDAGKCQSAAAMAVWLLTRGEAFRPGPALSPSRVTVVGWTLGSQSKQAGMGSVSLQDIRSLGPREAARRALAGVSPSASILVHLDIDVFQPRDVPASYFPHADGLSLAEGTELLGGLLGDGRVRLVEVAEYALLRDRDQQTVSALIELLAATLRRYADRID